MRMNKLQLHTRTWTNLTNNIKGKKPDTKKYIFYGCIYVTTNQTKLTYGV